jgi:hypothetical protein
LAGRCANGAERDGGRLFHARLLEEHGADWYAVCGAKPGRRSAGWAYWRPEDRRVTCKRCAAKLRRLGLGQQNRDYPPVL